MAGAARASRSVSLSIALILSVSTGLAGCGGGGGGTDASAATAGNPTPIGSSPASPAPTPAPTPAPEPSPSPAPIDGNTAPNISGTATAFATVNAEYSFTPVATDVDDDTLGFSIQNKPEWASFNTVNGMLSGTPSATHAKTYSNIVITVNDGKTSVSLPAFAITVSEPAAADGVTLTWTPPTENEDGTALLDLAGYMIVYGPSSTTLHQSVRIENPGLNRYVLDNLPAGTYYFGVKAFTSAGTESGLSNVVNKVVL